MNETHSLRPLRAHNKSRRARGRRLGSTIEQLEVRWLMAADDPTDFAAELQIDPIAEPAMLMPSGNPNTTAASLLAAGGPGDPALPGFNNVARSGENGAVIYLGAGWALTANHVALPSSITWAGQAYTVDTSSVKQLVNANGSNTDLKMFKVNGDPPLPELFTSFIASAPASGRVIMVGNGYSSSGERFWSVNRNTTPWIWTEIAEPANPNYNNYAGVTVTGPRVVRWGENMVHDTGLYTPIGNLSVAGFTTRFDRQPYTNRPALANEAQASSGDSGGAVFSLEGGRWVLSGIMLAVSGNMSGQPSSTALYGGITFIADLSVYRTQILAIAGVVNRQLVYNNSSFDGNTPEIGPGEDAAIASDKTAYLPGSGLSTFDSISSYSRGINSVVVDIASVHGTLTAADFRFKIGTTSSLDSWIDAPAPTLISVRAGAGQGGSDRVHIIWPDGAIFGVWLEVTVKGNDATGGFNANTGLAKTDVFYFGHRPGDAGGNSTSAAVTSAYDELGARLNPGVNESVSNVYDFDRNRLVSAADQLFARFSVGILLMIDLPAKITATSLAAEEETPGASGIIELAPPQLWESPCLQPVHDAVFAALAQLPPPPPGLFSGGLFSGGLFGGGFSRRPNR